MLEDAIRRHGLDFELSRADLPYRVVTGLKNHEKETGKPYIGFMPGTDVKAEDILVSPSGDTYYVTETETQFNRKEPFQLKAFFQTEREHQAAKQSSSSVFNIQNAYGSIIGTNNQATINYTSAVSELKEAVAADTSADKEQLEKIVSLLEMAVNDQVPLSKGLFSKFREVMERNSWITGSVANALISWLLTKTL